MSLCLEIGEEGRDLSWPSYFSDPEDLGLLPEYLIEFR